MRDSLTINHKFAQPVSSRRMIPCKGFHPNISSNNGVKLHKICPAIPNGLGIDRYPIDVIQRYLNFIFHCIIILPLQNDLANNNFTFKIDHNPFGR